MVMVKKLSSFILFTSCLLISIQINSVFAEVTATLSRQSISVNESVNLVISSSKDTNIDPTFLAQVSANFDIDNQGKSSETSCVNFKCTSLYKTTLLLTPKKVGLFTIPVLIMGKEQTEPLKIKINPVNKDPSQGNLDPIFAELTANKTRVSVQEQVIIKLRINSSIQLSNLQLEPFDIPNTIIKELTNTNYQRTIGDTPYTTYDVTYAVFPQASGVLDIPSIRVFGVIPDNRSQGGFGSFFNTGKKVSIRTNPLSIEVDPVPEGSQLDWLPAQSVVIKEKWLSDLNNLKVGDSITREITLLALGLSAEQLPAQTFPGTPQFKTYQEKPELENKENEQGIIGIRKEKIALVPNASGEITIPAIHIKWWDVHTKLFKEASLPEKILHIKPNPELKQSLLPKPPSIDITSTHNAPSTQENGLNIPPQEKPTLNVTLWKIIAILSLLINLILVFIILRVRLQNSPTGQPVNKSKKEKDTFVTLEEACQSKDPNAIKLALLAYTRQQWPEKSINSLTDIRRVLSSKPAQEIISQLDTAIYNKTPLEVDIESLKSAFSDSNEGMKGRSSKTLYPTQ